LGVIRRIHVPRLYPGKIPLDADEAHHVIDVLRLKEDAAVEIFDDEDRFARGVIAIADGKVLVRVESIAQEEAGRRVRLTVAAAVPKGDRADWMIQKLSELGVDRFIPLAAERSVVIPAGRNKSERWGRLAIEAAKQSRRIGVMKIGEVSQVKALIESLEGPGWFLSTGDDARPIVDVLAEKKGIDRLTLFIGPEGGWTEGEMTTFVGAEVVPVGLTSTILRVETAAIAAAAVVGCWQRESSG
jgi:16S rRNA (uracil1498-N3)-methyltransferase